ncbi:MAG: hypothetical protein GYA23_02895 [Methanomicrobiales archaeon]|nr:hypothetical protein [Methanomicrobiales archaeon]
MTWEKKRVLVTVKTYPEKSRKHKTVVCTAGITEEGEWIRLYPIKVDTYTGRSKIRKYDWIEVECKKATDERLKRKESYKVREGSIRLLGQTLASGNGKTPWVERNKILLPHVAPSLEYLKEKFSEDRTSLGLIKPKTILEFYKKRPLTPPAQSQQYQKTLFDDQLFSVLDAIPKIFSYKFKCEGCNGNYHNILCEDWELYALYQNEGQRYRDDMDALWQKIHEKFYQFMIERDLYFYMGTHSLHPTWLIIGLYYPPKNIIIPTTPNESLARWIN